MTNTPDTNSNENRIAELERRIAVLEAALKSLDEGLKEKLGGLQADTSWEASQ